MICVYLNFELRGGTLVEDTFDNGKYDSLNSAQEATGAAHTNGKVHKLLKSTFHRFGPWN